MGGTSLDLSRLPLEPVPLRAVRCGRTTCGPRSMPGSRASARWAASASTSPARSTRALVDGPSIYAAGRSSVHHRRPRRPARATAALGARVRPPGRGTAPGRRPGRVRQGGPRAAAPERQGDQGLRVGRGAVRDRRPDPPAVHGGRVARRSSRSPAWPTAWSRHTATASPGIMAALEAGVRTIEHGTYLDDESAAAMRETGRDPGADPHDRRGDPDQPRRSAVRPEETRRDRGHPPRRGRAAPTTPAYAWRWAPISRCEPGRSGAWGRNGRELPLLERVRVHTTGGDRGRHRSGTGHARAAGAPFGTAAKGYDADVIMLDGDPLVDLKLLADPTRVLGVWRAGRRVKY